jgi:hypothetical protein
MSAINIKGKKANYEVLGEGMVIFFSSSMVGAVL